MTVRLNLNTLTKIVAMSPTKQFKEIENILNEKKGYPFYRTLTAAIKSFTINPDKEPNFELFETCGSTSEKAHNSKAFTSFLKWTERKKRTYIEDSVKHSIYYPAHDIEIWCEPSLFFIENNTLNAVFTWAIKTPELRQAYAGLALQLAKDIFSGTRHDNYKCGIIDLSSEVPKYYSEKQIGDLTPIILSNELANISRIARVISSQAS